MRQTGFHPFLGAHYRRLMLGLGNFQPLVGLKLKPTMELEKSKHR